MDSATSTAKEDASKGGKTTTHPELEMAPSVSEGEELTPEEVQLFEMENKKLFAEMNSLVDEVRQIEGRVVEISQLQEIFSEKVLHQSTRYTGYMKQLLGQQKMSKEEMNRLERQLRTMPASEFGFCSFW